MSLKTEDVEKERLKLMSKYPDGLFVLALKVENIQRIKSARATFNAEGGLVLIGGDNAQGKTSFLDALWYGLAGAATVPPDPIRAGEKRAKIEMTIGDKNKAQFIVTRHMKYGSRGELKQSIEVRPASPNEKPYESPQTLLNALWQATSFDPLEFNRLSTSEQRTKLLQIAGLTDELTALIKERDEIKAERILINRDAKQIEGELVGLDVPDSNTPDEEIRIVDLMAQLRLLNAQIDDQNMAEQECNSLGTLREMKIEAVKEFEAKLAEARQNLTNVDKRIASAVATFAALPTHLKQTRQTLSEEIAEAEATNEKVRAAIKYNETADRLTLKQTESRAKTDKLTEIEESKLKLLEHAEFPINDVTVTDTGVIYQGKPLEQAAHSDRLCISIAIAMSLNPLLRLIISKEANQLGKARQQLLHEMAITGRFLVLAEMVTDDKSIGIYFEDGEIVEPEAEHKSIEEGDESPANT